MPFKSKKQQRLFFSGALPGVDKETALEWAHETKNMKKLPERAPAEKGKPTLRSKKANGDMIAHFQEHPDKLRAHLERKSKAKGSENDRRHYVKELALLDRKKTAVLAEVADLTPELEQLLIDVFKTAGLGTAASLPSAVGRFKGMMSANALKPPGFAASKMAINPRKTIVSAMNVTKPTGSL
jgi:hypothetical protein